MSPTVTTADPVFSVLLTGALKGTVLLLLVGLVAMLTASASRRHFTWMVGFVALGGLVLLDPWVPHWEVLPDWYHASWVDALEPWLWPIWLVGAGLFCAKVLLGLWALFRIERSCSRLQGDPWDAWLSDCCGALGVRRSVRLLKFPGRIMPMTWGLLKNYVVLPSSAVRWSSQRTRAVLMHELAHVRRRDYGVSLLRDAVCAFYWYHPLIWWAAREMDEDREEASDDAVLAAGHRPVAYAEHLATVATRGWGRRFLDPQVRPRVALAEKPLLVRIRSILSPWKSRHPISWSQRYQVVAVVLGLLLAVLLVGPKNEKNPGESRVVGHSVGGERGSAAPLLDGGSVSTVDLAASVRHLPVQWAEAVRQWNHLKGRSWSHGGELGGDSESASIAHSEAMRAPGPVVIREEAAASDPLVSQGGRGAEGMASTTAEAKPEWRWGGSLAAEYSTSPPEATEEGPEGIDIGEVMASFENVGHIGVDDFDLGDFGDEGSDALEESVEGFDLGEFSFAEGEFGIASLSPGKVLPLDKAGASSATQQTLKVSKDRGGMTSPSSSTVKVVPIPEPSLEPLPSSAHTRPDPGLETRVGLVTALSTGKEHLAITFRRKAGSPTASFRFEASPDLSVGSWDFNPDHFVLAGVRSVSGAHEATIVLRRAVSESVFRYLRIRSTSATSD